MRSARGTLAHLVPEDDDAALRAGLAGDSGRRLARILARWPAGRPGTRGALRGVDRRIRGTVLASGILRTWLASVEDALETRDLARAAARRPPSSAAWSRLLDRVADLGALPALAPRGSLPRDFPARAHARAARDLERLARSIGPVLRVAAADARGSGPSPRRLVRSQGGAGEPTAIGRFADRVPQALALLAAAWPDAARMVLGRVQAVVPIDDRAVVSYSSAREPGIAYVNVRSRPRVRLAEDLLHETTHMRVHEIESLHPLVEAGADAGDEPRFHSPWRREGRPLRGLLHGACTFTVGARFFARMLAASEPRTGSIRFGSARRAWLARRFLEEMESTRVALRTLGRPDARRLLTATGRTLVRTATRERASLLAAARASRAFLAGSARR